MAYDKAEQDAFEQKYKSFIDGYFEDRKHRNESFIKALGNNYPNLLDKLDYEKESNNIIPKSNFKKQVFNDWRDDFTDNWRFTN